jgi:hypothetical protein
MMNSTVCAAAVLALATVPLASAQSEKAGPTRTRTTLSTADREEIRVLNARYSLALGMCDAEHWPAVFVAPDGFFASASRGKVQGQHRLAEMNRSYDCVYVDGKAPDHAPGVAVPYKIELTATPDGADGVAYYNGGRYEDVYVKTRAGWRFKGRTVMSNREMAAGYSWKDLEAIQQLALANGGPYEDVYEPWAHGRRLKHAAVSLSMGPNGTATGKAYLKDGSHYEDVYAKTASGWRFQSRTLVGPK